uniref:Pyridoxal phosphate-dependent transferase n=1 Tax=Angiostrongylus cantonensis TaxID=6313 RepID=A0A0K0D3J0_ANGCA
MCAGPYAQYLMGIDEQMALQYFSALKESDELDRTHLRRVGEYSSNEVLRPGFTRISVPYFWTDKQVDHVIECIQFVSKRAADFIHLYQLNCESAEWHHYKQRTFHARKWLGHVTFTGNGLVLEERKAAIPDGRLAIDGRFSHLRWFLLPIESDSFFKSSCTVWTNDNDANPSGVVEYSDGTEEDGSVLGTEKQCIPCNSTGNLYALAGVVLEVLHN